MTESIRIRNSADGAHLLFFCPPPSIRAWYPSRDIHTPLGSATTWGLSRQSVSPHWTVIYLGVTVGTLICFFSVTSKPSPGPKILRIFEKRLLSESVNITKPGALDVLRA